MNSLTVNLHLLMISFYRPTRSRRLIVIEDSAFPSDSYAARSQVALHGYDPDDAVVRLRPRPGEDALRTDDVVAFLDAEGERVALLLLGGVNYLTGELMDIPAITRAGQRAGAVVGWDLAHAVGNVSLQLSEWGVDWAAWCHYKYVNAGPGAVAGAFVHERHLADRSLRKLRAGGATDRRRGSRWPRSSTRSTPPTPGRCRTRRSSRWRRCWPRSRSSTRSGWPRCARSSCGSPGTWRRCSTRMVGRPAARGHHAARPRPPRRPAVGPAPPGLRAGRVRADAPRARGVRRRPRARRHPARPRAAVLHLPRLLAGGESAG